MESRKLLCLSEFIERHGMKCVYGGDAALITSESDEDGSILRDECGMAFYTLILIKQGRVSLLNNGKEGHLNSSDLAVILPYSDITGTGKEPYTDYIGILLDPTFADSVHSIDSASGGSLIISTHNRDLQQFHLDEFKANTLDGLFKQVGKAIMHPHLFKNEMVRSLISVCLMYIEGLGHEYNSDTQDFNHKKDIFMVFMHLANNNFRQERQLKFYADKLNISTTYLSRTVKEISGSTVFEHLSCLVFNEACRLLRSSDKSIGEISYELGFNDHSAFTSYFKIRAGKTPAAYRNSNKSIA